MIWSNLIRNYKHFFKLKLEKLIFFVYLCKMYKLYKIFNTKNNKIYIGMTKRSLKARFSQHKSDAKLKRTNSILYNAINKYGIEFFHIELLSCYNKKEECIQAEITAIANNIGGYNIAPGGEGGFIVTNIKRWKQKLSKARKGRKPSLGMKHSTVNKELFSKMSKEYWNTQKTYSWEDFKHLTHKEAKIQFGVSTTHYYKLKKRFESNELK